MKLAYPATAGRPKVLGYFQGSPTVVLPYGTLRGREPRGSQVAELVVRLQNPSPANPL